MDASPFVLKALFADCAAYYRESSHNTHGYRSSLGVLISTLTAATSSKANVTIYMDAGWCMLAVSL